MSRNHRHIPIDIFPFPRTARGRFLHKNPADEIDILTTRPKPDSLPLSMPLTLMINWVLIPTEDPIHLILKTHKTYQVATSPCSCFFPVSWQPQLSWKSSMCLHQHWDYLDEMNHWILWPQIHPCPSLGRRHTHTNNVPLLPMWSPVQNLRIS